LTSLRLRQLRLSVWPFGLITISEFLGAILIMRGAGDDPGPVTVVTYSLLASLTGFAAAALLIWIARRLIALSRSTRWRSVGAALLIYWVVATVSGALMAAFVVETRAGQYPLALMVLWTVTRPVNVLVLATIVQLVRDGVSTSRDVDEIRLDRLSLARSTNATLERAEASLRAESRRMLTEQVAAPLGDIVRDGRSLSDAELADRVDGFIASRLRPMAHVLHPVSVRLGLMPAMRSLDPACTIAATPTIERMDADGVLLDEAVRLQVYRWMRENIPSAGGSSAALVIRGRELEVSVHPSLDTPLDAVQLVAGLRRVRPGVIAAPLRGQVTYWVDIAADPFAHAPPRRERYRLSELLTVPLPHRLLLVVLLSLGVAPLQFVVYQWSATPEAILATVSMALAPILMAYLLGRRPAAQSTIAGAWRVVGEWVLISLAAVLGIAVPATIFGLFPEGLVEWLFMAFRMSYRYMLPGLAVVASHGLMIVAQRRLDSANEALEQERRRRVAILAESTRLDRDVAEALHRTVQGRLAAAVVMLRLGNRDDAWTQIVAMETVEVPELLGRMGGELPTTVLVVDPPMGLSVIQIGDTSFEGDMLVEMRSVISEVAANARRHGRASSLVISVEQGHGGWLIVCEDDGCGLVEGASPGLGSRLLDETVAHYGGSWSMESSERGCRVVIQLPVQVNGAALASSAV
jgi:hypothetical protein